MGALVYSAANAFYLESVFDLHHAELNETMGLALGKQFRQQSTACLCLSVFIKQTPLKCQ